MLKMYDLKDAGSILDFINTCITVRTWGITPNEYTCGDIYKIYLAWCFENNKIPELEGKFHKYLKKFDGNEPIKTFGGNKYYSRITLNQPTKKEYGISKPHNIKTSNDVVIYIQANLEELYRDDSLSKQISNIYKYCSEKKYNVISVYNDIGDYEDYGKCYQHLELIEHIYEHKIVKIIALNPHRIYNGFGNEVSYLINVLERNNVELEFVDNNNIEYYQLLNEYINRADRNERI